MVIMNDCSTISGPNWFQAANDFVEENEYQRFPSVDVGIVDDNDEMPKPDASNSHEQNPNQLLHSIVPMANRVSDVSLCQTRYHSKVGNHPPSTCFNDMRNKNFLKFRPVPAQRPQTSVSPLNVVETHLTFDFPPCFPRGSKQCQAQNNLGCYVNEIQQEGCPITPDLCSFEEENQNEAKVDILEEVDNFMLENFLSDNDALKELPVAAVLVGSVDLFSTGAPGRKRSRSFAFDEDEEEHDSVNGPSFTSISQERENFSGQQDAVVGPDIPVCHNSRRKLSGRAVSTSSIASINSAEGSMSHDDHWSEKFRELCEYREKHGDCMVPHNYKDNLSLARWVKRQRHQMKSIMEKQQEAVARGARPFCFLSMQMEERFEAFRKIGFVWNCQGTNWDEKISELCQYRDKHGDCNVPCNYKENPKLGMWVKCQRRQYKLYNEGKQSSMTKERIEQLNSFGFNWGIRNYKKRGKSRKVDL